MSNEKKLTLGEAREIINSIDKEMARLFCERMKAVKTVAEYKQAHGLEIYDPEREKLVVEKNSEYITDPTLKEYYINFINDTMRISRTYQSRLISGMRVAYSGTKGAFAYIAARKLFPTANLVSYGSFEAAYKATEQGECDVAVLPIENSSNGEVGDVMDLLFGGTLFVNNSVDIAVTQDLLGHPDATIADITDVYSHPQALGQCSSYINKHGITPHEYANTALAAKFVSEKNDRSIAAIASAEAGDLFGLKVIERNINQSRSNTTRFLVCSRSKKINKSDEANVRSILIMIVRNEAGALAKAIDIIGSYGYNMQALRSRPMKELLWQYYFYIELDGSINTEKGEKMIAELTNYCAKLKTVGTYIAP